MGVFNVAAAFGKKSSSQDYGFLVDQLSILEASLKGDDGGLSPSDYDVLVSNAQKLYSHPGLTPAQRSNIEVKIAGYKRDKKIDTYKKTDDLSAIDRDMQNNNIDASSMFGQDPLKFMRTKELSIMANLRQVETAIQRKESSGDDSSAYWNKRQTLLENLMDIQQAIEDTQNYQGGSQPTSNMRAYIQTNSKGQIVNIDVLPYGSKSGYVDTNRVYGGITIAGKPNNKLPNGNVAFKLGNENLVASGSMTFDPATGQITNNNVLKPENEAATVAGISKGGTQYKSITDLGVTTQKATYPEEYLKPTGSKFIYKMNSDGNFTKYASTTPQALGITDDDLLPVTSDFESNGIVPYVKDTVMNGPEVQVPIPPVGSALPQSTPTTTAATTTTAGAGQSRTPSPTERAPQSAGGIAGKAWNAAKSFLGNLFGQ